MVGEFAVTLSSGEIYVLAALMDYNCVFGIESTTLRKWAPDISKESKKSIRQLEAKKLIRCDLDGTVYIEHHIQRIIRCICDADIIITFSGSLYNGKGSAVYTLSENAISSLVKAKPNGDYSISLGMSFDFSDIFGEVKDSDCELHERILLEEASHIQQKIVSFQQDEAEQLLSKAVTAGSSVARLAKVLSKNCKYMDIQVHKKTSSLYNNVYSCVLASDDEGVYQLQLDNNDVLFIDTADVSSICDHLNSIIN